VLSVVLPRGVLSFLPSAKMSSSFLLDREAGGMLWKSLINLAAIPARQQ
jgi:hypothetical protein